MSYGMRLSPTVVPSRDFDPKEDAETLRKAMKGFGCDGKAVIEILANRSNSQRHEIAKHFKTLYGKDLIENLKSELSGNMEDTIIAMMTPRAEFLAKELHGAMSGVGTADHVLVEVLCASTNNEIEEVKQAYEQLFEKSLEDDLISETSGNFKRILVSLCTANRDESGRVDTAEAVNDARELLRAGELQVGTDESKFNEILASKSYAQLRQTFIEYENLTGHGIEKAISKEFSGDIEKALLAIVECVKDRPKFFAEKLYTSMKGFGTQDKRLIRLVVSRSEIDMGEIKEAFNELYGKSLEEMISGDCSGNYKHCLLTLIA